VLFNAYGEEFFDLPGKTLSCFRYIEYLESQLSTANDQITRMREMIGRIVITPNISADELEKLYDEAMEFLKQPTLVDTGKEDNNASNR